MGKGRRRLTAEDWTAAAVAALGEGGLAAVAVEPLAARLGTTKGSFYWHFPNREALVSAALALWEQRSTEDRIFALDAEPDPVTRLRTLFRRTSEQAGRDPVEMNIRAAAANEIVAPVLRRVMQRRIGYVVELFEQIGFTRAEAERRAMLGFTAYIGHGELAAHVPDVLPIDGDDGLADYVESALDLLLRDAPVRGPVKAHCIR